MRHYNMILALAAVFAFCSAALGQRGEGDFSAARQSSAAVPPKAISVPFELLQTQHMAIQVKINGTGPYRVIFDTGAPINLLNNKVAKQAGIFPKNFRAPFFTLFGSMGQFDIKELEVGDLKVEKLSTIVMDHPTVSLMAQVFGPIEGIIGFSFFARYQMTLDYQAKTLTFVPNNYEPPDMMKRMMTMMAAPNNTKTKILAPAGQWGFRVAKDADDQKDGVNVTEVLAGSPAAKAGLQVGDRLLTLDGRWTDSVPDCYEAAGYVRPGNEARLVVQREGKEMALTVMVDAGI